MFVFSPKWDMRFLRAKEIKDRCLNSQAVPKILIVHKKNGTAWFHNGSGSFYFSNTHTQYEYYVNLYM